MVKIIRFFFVGLLLGTFCPDAWAKGKYAAVVMDGHTGGIIDSSQCFKPAYPASLTKMMTLLLLFEALKKNKVTLDTRFGVSEKASAQRPSKLGVKPYQTLSVRECILALSVCSANDVAVVVSENLAGSQERFVRLMNQRACTLRMKNTYFCNPSGWHHPLQKTTAYDMALLIRALRRLSSHYASFLCQKSFSFQNRNRESTNKLLGRVEGLSISKTGYTGPALYNLATLTQRGSRCIIVVVMGMQSGQVRDKQVKNLIEAAYSAPYLLSSLLILPALKTAKVCPGSITKNAKTVQKKPRKPKCKRVFQIQWDQIA